MGEQLAFALLKLEWALHLKMSRRCAGEGTPISSSVSSLPGRRSAASSCSARLLAAITTSLSAWLPARKLLSDARSKGHDITVQDKSCASKIHT